MLNLINWHFIYWFCLFIFSFFMLFMIKSLLKWALRNQFNLRTCSRQIKACYFFKWQESVFTLSGNRIKIKYRPSSSAENQFVILGWRIVCDKMKKSRNKERWEWKQALPLQVGVNSVIFFYRSSVCLSSLMHWILDATFIVTKNFLV